MARRSRCVVALFLAGTVGLLTAGCGASNDAAAERAEHFYSALEGGDGAGACADLAREARSSLEQQEQKPCAEAILDQDLPNVSGRTSVKVYGSMAQVAFDADTTFLSRFEDGWRLTAAGCTPERPGGPYDCAIEVG